MVCALEPTFGGINLEDIKSPECFYIEQECERRMGIPVMHDDQHGTAIVAGAGLINAAELVGKRIEDLQVRVVGCGAAGFTCAKYFVSLGVPKENLIAMDIDGVVHEGRADLEADPSLYLHEVASTTEKRTFEEVFDGADVFLGLSAANLLKPKYLASMNRDPLLFALANPVPEIGFHAARAVRDDVIMATGRSDYPNQINNVCAFPYIFRGALDCRATNINEEMKHACTKALAALAKTKDGWQNDGSQGEAASCPEFGRDYIIPKPFDKRILLHVAPAIAEAAMETGVARRKIDLEEYRNKLAAES